MRSDQSLVGNLSQYFPSIYNSSFNRNNQLNQLSHTFNSAMATTASKLGQIKTNILYSIKHSDSIPLSRRQIQISVGGPSAQLLGQEYTAEQAYKFLFAFRTTLWFTYRKGIKDIQTDNGWGCMIRAVQMVFAQVLKRHLLLKNTQQDQFEVIRHFSEQSDGVLSLTAICEEGKINKRWTSALEIFTHFRNIMKLYPQKFTFYFQVYSSGVYFKEQKDVLLPSYPALVSLSNRVSMDIIPQQLHKHYFELMKHQSWVGTIGGLHGQALYILGSYQNKVILLDPHKVQSNEEELQVQTYSCKTPRGIQLSALSPSLSFCYYFKTKEEHFQWLKWISDTCQQCYPNLVFEFISDTARTRSQKLLKERQGRIQKKFEQQRSQESGDMELQIMAGEGENSGDFQILQ